MFTAHGAMAVSHRSERSVHFVPDAATQTLSLVHLNTSANALLRMRGRGSQVQAALSNRCNPVRASRGRRYCGAAASICNGTRAGKFETDRIPTMSSSCGALMLSFAASPGLVVTSAVAATAVTVTGAKVAAGVGAAIGGAGIFVFGN